MATKKQTTGDENTATPKKQTAANGKTSTAKKGKAETTNAATPEQVTASKAPAATATTESAAKAPAAKTKKAPAEKAATTTTAKPTATASASAATTKLYGEIEISGDKFLIHKGSIEGQLQLVPNKGNSDLASRIPGYKHQFVTVRGEFAKASKSIKQQFTVHSVASHDEIARRAYELSHDNPTSVEDNWFRAEDELLGR